MSPGLILGLFFVMHLIEYDNYEIKISPEALLVKPIREIWESDNSHNKESFLSQMSFMFFMIDPRSTYSYITDLTERAEEIIAQEGLPHDFKPSEQLKKAMEVYEKHTITSSYALLEAAKIAVDKVGKFLKDVDLNTLDDKGKPVYTINSITSAIKQIPQLAKDLVEAEKVVAKEIEEKGRARGGNNKTIFDDGFDIANMIE